jgi:hypothetical protein
MKKISIRNYFEPTPKNVQKWLLALKSVMATIGGAAYFSENQKLAFWVLVGGAVLNEFANLFSNGTKENESN